MSFTHADFNKSFYDDLRADWIRILKTDVCWYYSSSCKNGETSTAHHGYAAQVDTRNKEMNEEMGARDETMVAKTEEMNEQVEIMDAKIDK